MLSRLENIIRTQMRHAESTDTRQHIQRRDDKNKRRNQDDQNQSEESDLWHDDINIDVLSVKNILINLMREEKSDNGDNINQENQEDSAPSSKEARIDYKNAAANPAEKIKSQQAAKAAQAYQRTWETAYPEEMIQKPEAENIPNIALSGDEKRMINDLITALDTLITRDIFSLRLEKDSTFLESLKTATYKALADSA